MIRIATEERIMSEANTAPHPKFIAWIDGVGGYLVCTPSEVTLGQANFEQNADIAIRGDLSRKHAKFLRQGESYILVPQAETFVENTRVREATLLSDHDEIQFGASVKLRFRRPHPLSATARLEFVSHHRPDPHVDAILLMAESCVLGPRSQNHVVCREWTRDLILYKQNDQLCCRTQGDFQVDGTPQQGRAKLHLNSLVTSADFSLRLEHRF